MNRIIYSDNGTLTDYSLELSRYDSSVKTFSFVTSEDAFYIGCDLPFNHFFVQMGTTVNAISSTLSISLYDGTAFRAAQDIIDQTNGLNQSGIIRFTPDRDYVWQRSDTSYNGQTVLGLTSLKIYNLYWAKLTYSATMTASVTMKYIGHRFCDDTDIGAEFPGINRQVMRDAFTTSLANYNEQIVRASDHIINDLKRMGIIEQKEQILDSDDLRIPCVYKSAELIYNALGDDYIDQRDDARVKYKTALDKKLFIIDKNKNGIVDQAEKTISTGWMSR